MATEEGDGDKELPDEDKGTGNRLVFKGKNVIKDSGLKVEAVNDDVKSDDVGTLQAKDSQSQQQEQGWQRFLHVTSIKVLLVENDDSTRYILTALLRNCNYEVIEAANGLQAWKILENLTNHIDLVLSEVVMPGVSGLGLLYKIMSHKTRNNIPVIMMSSHDSMGLVFKCLSKGAVDFLVKPIRKNELKNLWQHVWRRCHSSSGSGSESGSQTQKSVKSKRSEQYGNNSGSDDRDDNRRNGPLGNGSDDGSGTQSSWTKQAVEVASSQAVSPCDQALEHVDSTCAQALSFNEDTSAHGRAHLSPSKNESDDAREGKPSITGSLRDPKLKPENAIEDSLKNLGVRHKSAVEMDSNASNLKANHHVVTADKVVDLLEINITSTDDSKHHVVESSLKRPRGLEEAAIAFQVNRNVLRRSELSAFSRYNSSSNQTRTLNGITHCSSLVENSLETAKSEPMPETEARTNKTLVDPTTNGVRDSAAMGSTTNILSSEPLPFRNTNGNRDTGLACTSSSGNASGCGSGNTMDPFKLVRAAALTKFRQKK